MAVWLLPKQQTWVRFPSPAYLMPKTILIDGSNAVFALFGAADGSRDAWDREAERFVSMVGAWAAGQPKVEVEIVFDGGFRQLVQGRGAVNTRVLFSDRESADSLIMERLSVLNFYGKSATLVTQDRALAEAAQAEGARVLKPEDFWNRIARY